MKVHTDLVRFNFSAGRVYLRTIHIPNWFEWLVLCRRRKIVSYLGRGSKWYYYPSMEEIKSKYLIGLLQNKERQYKLMLGNKKSIKLPTP